MSTKQVETATVIGTITLTGNASVIITSAYMSNSPKTFSVAVSDMDTASVVAGLIRTALAFDTDVSAEFLVSGTGADVVLTEHVAKANDTTLNIAIDNGDCTGLTAAPTSTNTLAGSGIANGYATLADYKSWIAVRGLAGTVGTDTSDDAAIEVLIEGASRWIDGQLGFRFYVNSADETRYYRAETSSQVFIEGLAAAPTSIAVDSANDRTYATVLATTDYDLLPSNALLNGSPYAWIEIAPASSESFVTTNNGVKIVGRFGYPAVPTDIKEACLMIAQNTYATRSGQTSSGKITVTQAGVVIRPDDVPPLAMSIIENYQAIL